MKKRELLRRVREIHKGYGAGHGVDHLERVVARALFLCEGCPEADREKVWLIALLHDVDDGKFGDGKQVGELLGAYAPEAREELESEILSLSYSKGKTPQTLEGKIVQDADRLDALGALGVLRMAQYGEWRGSAFFSADGGDSSEEHVREKLQNLPGMMHTEEGKKLGLERYERLIKVMQWMGEEDGVRYDCAKGE